MAATMVFLFHASLSSPALTPYLGETAQSIAHAVSRFGGVSVSFFFILSGFVLAWGTQPDADAGRFWRRRLVRLFPNHLVTFAAAMALFAAATTTWREWVPNILLVQAWVPRFSTFFSVNIPSWSLSCEVFFYLCFPLLVRWIRRIDPTRLWVWACAVAGLVICLPAVTLALVPGGPSVPNGFQASVGQYWFVYLFPPVRMLEFVLGILMARIVLTGRWINLRLLPAMLLAVAGYVLAMYVPPLYGLNAAEVVPLALLIGAAASADLRGEASPFRSRAMVRLGEVSFALYLVHAPVLIVGRTMMGGARYGALEATGVVLLLFAVSLAVAWLLHLAVERPLMRWLGSPRPEAVVPAQRSGSEQLPAPEAVSV